MQLATVPSLLFTYWLYGNNQMFGNKIDEIGTDDDLTFSHHTFSEKFDNGWLMITLLVTVMFIFLYLMVEVILEFKETSSLIEGQDDPLPNYFDSLKPKDCKEFLADEELFHSMGFKVLLPHQKGKVEAKSKMAPKSQTEDEFDHLDLKEDDLPE